MTGGYRHHCGQSKLLLCGQKKFKDNLGIVALVPVEFHVWRVEEAMKIKPNVKSRRTEAHTHTHTHPRMLTLTHVRTLSKLPTSKS